MLEANKKQVPLKSYSLKIRLDSVNQILKTKKKLHKPYLYLHKSKYTDQTYRPEDSVGGCIFTSVKLLKIENLVRTILYVTLIIENIFRVSL